MKIYNKKTFAAGVFLLALDVLLLAVNVRQGFSAVEVVWLLALSINGLGCIIRSTDREISREDKLKERDERNRLVKLKAQSRAFEIGSWGCFGAGVLLSAWGNLANPENAYADTRVSIGLGMMLAFCVLVLLNFITVLYYEKHT